jgi:hypothetical protein
MILKIKAFIYRFFYIFNISIYLAKKEERVFLESIEFQDSLDKEISVGLWQASNGFTTVWTYRLPLHKALISKIKHAFDFKDYND